ncbi:MAG: hypothetical protein CFE44_09630 [Burkholderiales bacterium PBB4]|nr:MAG: hypothetical protein CFE44_09630 [Burkholderiales bacterium PBB4]
MAGYAIVAQDHTALRAGPRDSTPIQAVLWQGDALEVRGQRLDYLQVYDHRRERAGYVRASQVRTTRLSADDAPELLSVVRFVRDLPGSEALGLAYSAAYLKAAAAGTNTAEAWDAMGQMAERLAARATSRQTNATSTTTAPTAADTRLAGQLEGLGAYGIKLTSLERDTSVQLCYDGEAFRRVLGQAATPEQRARAVLGLTRHDCTDPAATPTVLYQRDLARAKLLDQSLSANDWARLSPTLKNRLQMRRAGVLATLAHAHSRRMVGAETSADDTAMLQAAQNAISALAAVNKLELTDEDQADYHAAALRVGASLWAAAPQAVGAGNAIPAGHRPSIVTRVGQPGETCVALVDGKHDAQHPLHTHCTYGTVWTASTSVNPAGTAVALAVQPLATWRELWVYRKTADGWALEVLPPGIHTPEIGYVEHAGWVPGTDQLLLAREVLTEGRFKRNFEVLKLSDLSIDKQASTPTLLSGFAKGQSASWKALTVSLR